ncbi:MAG: NIPSNAP family protein [Rhodospirillales bacterium]|nr:MAG: NIPSNAP family protein [Rhodospirillales bacterium]
MIYELRIYRCLPGRLPALLKRFDTITLKLWEKHGIKQAGFWTTAIGESNQELYYLLAWDSLADREKKWAGSATDPEWLAKRAETEADGQSLASVPKPRAPPLLVGQVGAFWGRGWGRSPAVLPSAGPGPR